MGELKTKVTDKLLNVRWNKMTDTLLNVGWIKNKTDKLLNVGWTKQTDKLLNGGWTDRVICFFHFILNYEIMVLFSVTYKQDL